MVGFIITIPAHTAKLEQSIILYSFAVSVTLNVSEICPYQPVAAHCVVKKPLNDPNPFLSWQCSSQNRMGEERLVFCNTEDNLDLHCQFGTVFDVTGSCDCNDTIMSNVTFVAPPSVT